MAVSKRWVPPVCGEVLALERRGKLFVCMYIILPLPTLQKDKKKSKAHVAIAFKTLKVIA